jgi:hypothetical protein
MRSVIGESVLRGAVLVALASSAPAQAQRGLSAFGSARNLGQVIVTGISGSIRRNLDVKRESTGPMSPRPHCRV